MLIFALAELLKPIIKARLVIIDEVAPKIYLVAFGLCLASEPKIKFLILLNIVNMERNETPASFSDVDFRSRLSLTRITTKSFWTFILFLNFIIANYLKFRFLKEKP